MLCKVLQLQSTQLALLFKLAHDVTFDLFLLALFLIQKVLDGKFVNFSVEVIIAVFKLVCLNLIKV